MGVDNHFYLFNQGVYEQQILPAYRTFFKEGNPDPLIALCRKASRGLNQGPKRPGLYLPSEEDYREAVNVLNGKMVPERGTDCGWQDRIHKRLDPRQRFVRYTIGDMLIIGLCVPRDRRVNPVLDMMNTPLREYLYKRSHWILNFFAGIRQFEGRPLGIVVSCYHPHYFSKEEISEFRKRLLNVPAPERTPGQRDLEKYSREVRRMLEKLYRQVNTPEATEMEYHKWMGLFIKRWSQAKDDYNRLVKILDIAIEDPDLTILELLC